MTSFRHLGKRCLLLGVVLAMLCLLGAGCGGSASESTSSGGDQPGTATASGTTDADSDGSCPLSQAQVNAAFGFAVPPFEMPGVICAFTLIGEEAQQEMGREEPRLIVYSDDGGFSSSSSTKRELEKADAGATYGEAEDVDAEFLEMPEWGRDAGINLNYNGPSSPPPGASAGIYLPNVQMLLNYPEASLDVLRATALRLGAAAAD